MKREKNMTSLEENTVNSQDNFFIRTDLISPLQRQLLEQKILLANTPAGTGDQARVAREMRKLRLLESLAEAEKAKTPHYAVSQLVDIEEEIEAEPVDDEPGQPSNFTSRIVRWCGLEELWGDLVEERNDVAEAAGEPVARRWFLRQALVSVLPMMAQVARRLFKNFITSIAGRVISDVIGRCVEEILRRFAH